MVALKFRYAIGAVSLAVLSAISLTGTMSAQMDPGTTAAIQASQQAMQASQQASQQAIQDMQTAQRANQQAMEQLIQTTTDSSSRTRAKQGAQARTDKPIFSPKPGVYPHSTTITISDAVPNTPIYYTTDGSEPTSLSPAYKGPIQVTSTMHLKAIAESRYYASRIVRAKYKIESKQSAKLPTSSQKP